MTRTTRATITSLIALAFGAVLLTGPAAPAAAHDGLVSSTPAAGETLTDPPTAVTLTFSGEILEGAPTAVVIEVTDPAGAVVSEGDAAVDGVTVTQQVNPELPAGDYTVTWRVVSSDGHPISSDFHFFIADSAAGGAAPAPSEPSTPTPATPSPTAAASPSATSDASDGYGGEVSGGGAMFPLMVLILVVVLLGVLVVAVLRLGQRRRAQDARDAAKETPRGA